jgi:diaminopimelate decarboxylase
MELQWALKEKIFTNFDNFVEMDRAKVLIEKEDPELKKMMDEKKLGVCGLRINPLVGSGGGIQALCVSTEDSKFGIPVSQREELLKAYMDNPWMCSVHVHVGSGGMGSAILTAGIKTIVEFAKEVNSKAGYQQITDLDIGGGAPANYFSDTWGHKTQLNIPTFGEYASVLKSEVPELFSGEFKVITEFGQSIHAKCAFMLSQIEWMKGTEANPMAIVHFGAAECVRQIYGGSAHARRVEAYRSDGSRFEGPEAEAHYGQFTNGKFSVAGPLCFQGDFVAQGIGLPEDLGEGDWIAMKDAGANTLSFFSRHCSRLCPAIHGFRWSDENTVDDENLTLLKPREAMNSLSNFWGTGDTCN